MNCSAESNAKNVAADESAFYDRRAAMAAVVVCPLGAVLAILAEGIGVGLYLRMAQIDYEPFMFLGPALWDAIVILVVMVVALGIALPLAACYPFSRPPSAAGVVLPTCITSLVIALAASIGLLWNSEDFWLALVAPYCSFVIPPTSAATMCVAMYRWLARRHPDE